MQALLSTGTGLLAAALFGAASTASAQGQFPAQPVPQERSMGVNLTAVHDYTPEWRFVDVFKMSREWIPQVPGFGGPFDTGVPLTLDANGWPLLNAGEAAGTLMLHELDGHYPGGTYTVLYDGTGSITFGLDSSVISSQPGEIKINVIQGNGGIYLKIESSDQNDPIRNIRVIMPGFENTYQSEPFHPTFLERLEPYKFLRFMEWQRTNNQTMSDWAERPLVTDYTQTTSKGVALEYCVDLCNLTGKDGWFCVPHLYDDNSVREMARFLRDNLDPELKIYLEYSNEVWNGIYSQGQFSETQGLIAGLDPNSNIAGFKWYADRSVEIFQIFNQEFGASADQRLVRVLGGQSANPFVGTSVMDHNNAAQFADGLAIAPYFADTFGFPDQAAITLGKTVDEILADAEVDILIDTKQQIESNRDAAAQRGLALFAAEGGQRMAGEGPFQSNQFLADLFFAANRDPKMKDLMMLYLQQWQELTESGVIAMFESCTTFSIFGTYGLLEWQDQPLDQAPKYDAISEFAGQLEGITEFGTACGAIEITPISDPVIGNADFGVKLEGALPGVPCFLALGAENVDWLGIPLPLDLASFGAPGCELLIQLDQVNTTVSDADGVATFALPVPNDAGLVGKDIYAQWGATDLAANALGLVLSEALRLEVLD